MCAIGWTTAEGMGRDDGGTSVEYALLLAVIGLAVIVGATRLGDVLRGILENVVQKLPPG